MPTSLRDLPGVTRRPPRRSRRDPLGRGAPISVLRDPRQGFGGPVLVPGRRTLFDRRSRRLSTGDRLLIGAALLVGLFLLQGAWSATRVNVSAAGLADGDALTLERSASIAVRITVSPTDHLEASELRLDGQPVRGATRTKDGYRWTTEAPLASGRHRLELTVPRPILPASRHRWDFVVDATPPVIEAPSLLAEQAMGREVVIRGAVDADARLTADGEDVDVDGDGHFEVRYPTPPAGAVRLVATDAAGHTTTHEVFVPVRRPQVRGVHVSGPGWATRERRAEVLRMIDAGQINAVQLDLKNEAGEVDYDSELALAREAGAVRAYYDLERAVASLHDRGVRVIGRIVAFRDPILANHAWTTGRRDWVVQRPGGIPHEAYGGFTNFADDDVRAYNIAVAAEAIEAGVDEILWDYVRRPEGPLAEIVVPGLERTPEDEVAAFLAEAHDVVRAGGALQGASVFGIAADRPEAIAQNVPRMARHVDYLSPMVYPSLFVAGEYRVRDPVHTPGEIVSRALADFQRKVAGTGVRLTPWLQDFSLGATYGGAEVRAQIEAARRLGIEDFLLWNPRVRYHPEALPG